MKSKRDIDYLYDYGTIDVGIIQTSQELRCRFESESINEEMRTD